jgi:hypothetical protein
MLPTKFRFIWPNEFRGEKLKKSANQKQESPVAAMFVNRSGRNEYFLSRTAHRCFLPSFGSFGQAVSEEKNFKNKPIRKKSRMWRPCLLTDRDEICNRNKGLSIDASYQVSVHFSKRFQRRRFLKFSNIYVVYMLQLIQVITCTKVACTCYNMYKILLKNDFNLYNI